jgi:predicted site-specific integrase-resolvase
VSAQDFARAVLEHDKPEDLNAYMNDRDLAAIVCVSDSTVRRWASQGSITRHTAEDGSVLFWAPEVVEYAKTVTDPRAARRVNQQKANT